MRPTLENNGWRIVEDSGDEYRRNIGVPQLESGVLNFNMIRWNLADVRQHGGGLARKKLAQIPPRLYTPSKTEWQSQAGMNEDRFAKVGRQDQVQFCNLCRKKCDGAYSCGAYHQFSFILFAMSRLKSHREKEFHFCDVLAFRTIYTHQVMIRKNEHIHLN
ncbi:hypothetical protein QE152_g19041 [Popillia japonica]|uniref:Uncharacterized protein n=1 Tax=Popillia japonica TaxID=7064 RepID=A0AAW1L2L6_POPJA